MEKGVDSKEM